MPLQANKRGNSYKFNKIRLINYSSSPKVLFAAPRSRSWQSRAATGREKLSESSRLCRWPVGQRHYLQDGHRAAVGAGQRLTGLGVHREQEWGIEARPKSTSVQTGHEQVQLAEGTAVATTQTRLALDEATDALKLLVAEPALV